MEISFIKKLRVGRILLVMMFFVFASSLTCSGQIKWQNLESAQEMAKTSPKPIFIEFTAKWCGWCKKMEKTTFSSEPVIELLNVDFYAVKIDFDSEAKIDFQGIGYTGKELAKKFEIDGLPTMIYIPANLQGSSKIVGYKTTKQLIKVLNKMNNS